MTDKNFEKDINVPSKEIIIDGVDVKDCKRRIGKDNFCRYYKRPCTENNYNCIWKKYLRKEQECERLKDIIETKLEDANICDSALSYINDEYIYVKQQLDQLKAENENLKAKLLELLGKKGITRSEKEILDQYRKTLKEIKPILELYANSKMGEEQPDRTYKIMLSGGYIMAYDPKPAREGLKKISEVGNG